MNKPTSLNTNAIGFLGAVTLGIVMLSPAMTLYGGFGPAYLQVGKAAPLAFVFALIATLPTAASYALLARDFPNSGSAASWMAQAAPRRISNVVGKWAGWIVFFYYLFNFIIQPVTVGVFLNDLLSGWGFHPNFAVYAAGAILCCVWPASIAYRGISLSSRGALRFLLFESVIVCALCATVIWKASSYSSGHFPGTHLSLEGFHLAASPDGVPGLFKGMIFAMLAFCGFDVISTLSEEAKMSRKMIPQATFVALAIFGFFIIAGVWGFSYAATAARVKTVTDAGGMPISDIAQDFWGKWSFLVPITAISAALGIAVATAVGASRILFSMARNGLAPLAFGKLHEKYRVPWSAMHLVFGAGLIATLITGALLGPFYAFSWWATTSTFFAMVTYLMVNLSNLILFRKSVLKSPTHFFLHGFVPVFGIVVDGYILIRSFFIELWAQGWANGQSVIFVDVGFSLLALGIALYGNNGMISQSTIPNGQDLV
jgi:amino acid transporter